MSDPLLTLRGVKTYYGNVIALKGVDVDVSEGDYPNAKAEQEAKSDVEARVHEIANDVIEEREWATEDYENYDDDADEEFDERRGSKGEDQEDY